MLSEAVKIAKKELDFVKLVSLHSISAETQREVPMEIDNRGDVTIVIRQDITLGTVGKTDRPRMPVRDLLVRRMPNLTGSRWYMNRNHQGQIDSLGLYTAGMVADHIYAPDAPI